MVEDGEMKDFKSHNVELSWVGGGGDGEGQVLS